MTRQQFNLAILKLKEAYGHTKYPEVRCDVLFERFQGIPWSHFEKGIDNMIINCKFAPMMDEFYGEVADEVRTARAERVQKLAEGNQCVICKNSGRISVNLKPGQAAYSFRCDCKIGRTLFPNYPKFNPVEHKA